MQLAAIPLGVETLLSKSTLRTLMVLTTMVLFSLIPCLHSMYLPEEGAVVCSQAATAQQIADAQLNNGVLRLTRTLRRGLPGIDGKGARNGR